MVRNVILFLVAGVMFVTSCAFAAGPQGGGTATQGDLAKKMVDMFGWSEGLPDKPSDKDYLTILGGERSFRFEAEDIYDRTYDKVTVRDYALFGPFTGRGWLHGTTEPTAVHFMVHIPIAGKYTLKASSKGDGQLWSIAGRAFKKNSGEKLQETVIGQVFIPAGVLEFNAVIPAGGAIDYLTLSAPALAPVQPAAGWDFSAKLTGGKLAEVAAALLGSENFLPEDTTTPHKLFAASSVSPLPAALYLTDSKILGKPVADKWVRAGQVAALLSIPVEIDTSAVYQLRVRFVGPNLTAGFGERSVAATGKDYLDWIDCGVFRLAKGGTTLNLLIPPSGGVDSVELVRRKSAVSDYVALANLGKGAEEPVSSAELDNVLKSLQERFKERR